MKTKKWFVLVGIVGCAVLSFVGCSSNNSTDQTSQYYQNELELDNTTSIKSSEGNADSMESANIEAKEVQDTTQAEGELFTEESYGRLPEWDTADKYNSIQIDDMLFDFTEEMSYPEFLDKLEASENEYVVEIEDDDEHTKYFHVMVYRGGAEWIQASFLKSKFDLYENTDPAQSKLIYAIPMDDTSFRVCDGQITYSTFDRYSIDDADQCINDFFSDLRRYEYNAENQDYQFVDGDQEIVGEYSGRVINPKKWDTLQYILRVDVGRYDFSIYIDAYDGGSVCRVLSFCCFRSDTNNENIIVRPCAWWL